MRRRRFLKCGAALGAMAAGGTLFRSTGASAAFGDTPEAYRQIGLPPELRAENILEVFLYGGLTTWETFYGVEEYGRPDDPNPELRATQLYTFHDPASPKDSVLAAALGACGRAGDGARLVPFARDALGMNVHLGPLLAPLIARKDILDRMRIVVTRHDLEPHEAAIPYALCGRTLGSPQMACLGAHVQRHAMERGDPARSAPYAYTFTDLGVPGDNLRASLATGLHPATARPLLLRASSDEFLPLLQRPKLGDPPQRAAFDRLLSRYVDQYRDRVRYDRQGEPLRAARLSELSQTIRSVASAHELDAVLDSALFEQTVSPLCGGTGETAVNAPAICLRIIAHLLAHPTLPARYCCFVDPGLVMADGGGGYDTHAETCLTQTMNLGNTLTELLSHVRSPDEQGPEADGKIDLDRTLIILNMEFGRSPGAQNELGRNHWPYGYVTVYLGGPIREAQRGIYGAIGPDGRATTYVKPPEQRIAALLALGIWPFAQEGFGVSDVEGTRNEGESAVAALARVLGHG
ncbi:DUF1501 domain-containing protein [Sorangium sp. So ce1097]|uniref:DUF1501 domain-containing protein n=1 Tax=Sorangium sp. So ce1097 TaxID=3133330 RepID=UPI003F62264A